MDILFSRFGDFFTSFTLLGIFFREMGKRMSLQPKGVFFTRARPDQKWLLHEWFRYKHIKEWLHGKGAKQRFEGSWKNCLEKYQRQGILISSCKRGIRKEISHFPFTIFNLS